MACRRAARAEGYGWRTRTDAERATRPAAAGPERAPWRTEPVQPVGGGDAVVLLREEIGDVLRDARRQQGRTLREVSSVARVSLGYLSEVERGQKEASSELLASICDALDVELADLLAEVSLELRVAGGGAVRPIAPTADAPAAAAQP